MGKSQKRYAPEFRRQMVELYRTGHSFNELAKEYRLHELVDPHVGQAGGSGSRPRGWRSHDC